MPFWKPKRIQMNKTSLTINIGDRSYPLVVDATEAEQFKEAAQRINQQMESFSISYPKTDRVDLLAMTALALATQKSKQSAQLPLDEINNRLQNIIEKLATFS